MFVLFQYAWTRFSWCRGEQRKAGRVTCLMLMAAASQRIPSPPHPGSSRHHRPISRRLLRKWQQLGTATQRAGRTRTKRAEHADGRKGRAGKRARERQRRSRVAGAGGPRARMRGRTRDLAPAPAASAESAWQTPSAPHPTPPRPFHARTLGRELAATEYELLVPVVPRTRLADGARHAGWGGGCGGMVR